MTDQTSPQGTETPTRPVIVVGGGLAGLCCAARLHRSGIDVLVLEAADGVGGRVRTDEVDGYRLDRGFQVLLTAYPQAREELDFDALGLRTFYPGALIQVGSRRYRFADPWQKPMAALGAITAPVATIRDGLRIARMRAHILRQHDPRGGRSIADRAPTDRSTRERPSGTTLEYLEACGLSNRVIERFLRPFFGGVFLDRNLSTPSWFFEFVFAMFARGHAALPARGMGAIAEQLAAALPPESIRLQTRVRRVAKDGVEIDCGEFIDAAAVVLATDAAAAQSLFPELPAIAWNETTTVYYAASKSPIGEGILVLNGNGSGRVNSVCAPSDLSPEYAPKGSALISVSLLDIPDLDDAGLDAEVRKELRTWCGSEVDDWRLLRTYRIRHALPRMAADPASAPVAPAIEGVVTCGDYCTDPSIDGALRSGRTAAEHILSSMKDASHA